VRHGENRGRDRQRLDLDLSRFDVTFDYPHQRLILHTRE
jgi:hypothetical protein